MPRFGLLLLAGALLAAAPGAASAQADADLALVLAVDASRSMDADEQALQRQGYVAAFRHPELVAAVRSGRTGRIAVAYVEWGGPERQQVVVPWTVIDGAAAAAGFAERLAAAPTGWLLGTSISGALGYSAGLFAGSGVAAERRVIDISGDGPNNVGRPVAEARDAALAAGIVVNGLPIMLKEPDGQFSIPDLDLYYRDCVIGGPGAFLVPVRDLAGFAAAIRRKLVLEIAGPAPVLLPAAIHAAGAGADCLIGERLRQRWMME